MKAPAVYILADPKRAAAFARVVFDILNGSR